MEAIERAPIPKNVQELCSFLELINFYRMFFPNLARLLQPLNTLLQQECNWKWTQECTKAFKVSRYIILSANLQSYYDPMLPLKYAEDVSVYGLGAVIINIFPDGLEGPIAFASRTIVSSELNYAQIEKVALALVSVIYSTTTRSSRFYIEVCGS